MIEEQPDGLAAACIAVVEGLGLQRALDPDGFDHERAWRTWRRLIDDYLSLPGDLRTKRPELPRRKTLTGSYLND
jgi:uncharacterized protein YjeT (DUF2065 family)